MCQTFDMIICKKQTKKIYFTTRKDLRKYTEFMVYVSVITVYL